METVKVGNTCYHDRSFEAGRLCHCPGCHKASITPTCNSNTVSIYKTAFGQVVNAIQDILKVFAAHIAHDCISEGYPASPTAADVGPQYSIASRSERLRPIRA